MIWKKLHKKTNNDIKVDKDNPLWRLDYHSKLTTLPLANRSDITLGKYTYGSPEVRMGDGVARLIVGKYTMFGPNVRIHLTSDHNPRFITCYDIDGLIRGSDAIDKLVNKGNVVVGNDVWIGDGAIILPGVKIGDGSIVAAGSVVTHSIEPYSIVGGVPARIIRKRFPEDIIQKLLLLQWWNWSDNQVYEAKDFLQSSNFDGLFEYYNKNVKKRKQE